MNLTPLTVRQIEDTLGYIPKERMTDEQLDKAMELELLMTNWSPVDTTVWEDTEVLEITPTGIFVDEAGNITRVEASVAIRGTKTVQGTFTT